jgi:hypothetical protein
LGLLGVTSLLVIQSFYDVKSVYFIFLYLNYNE